MLQFVPNVYTEDTDSNYSLINQSNNEIINLNKDQIIKDPEGNSYTIIDIIGEGQFGKVFQVISNDVNLEENSKIYALKITRSQEHFRKQASHEISIHQHVCF